MICALVESRTTIMQPDETIATRDTLLHRLRNCEDDSTWREFFDKYWKLIYNFALRAGLSDSEAQDIVQETVISVARNIENYTHKPEVCTFRSWLLRVTRWRINNQFERRDREAARFISSEEEEAGLVADLPDPAGAELDRLWEEEWSRHVRERALEKVRRAVPALQFQIFDLYVNQEWPVSRIKSVLNVSAGQVYLAKHRVGALYKKALAKVQSEDRGA